MFQESSFLNVSGQGDKERQLVRTVLIPSADSAFYIPSTRISMFPSPQQKTGVKPQAKSIASVVTPEEEPSICTIMEAKC